MNISTKQQSQQIEQQLQQHQQVYQQQSYEGQNQQCCVIIRNLDQGLPSIVDPKDIQKPQTLPIVRKRSAWQDYWQQRQKIKHQLLRLVNGNHLDQLQKLLKQNQKLKDNNYDVNDMLYLDGWNLLHHAVSKKFIGIVNLLIFYHHDLNKTTTSMSRTALHIAVLENSEEIVELLLDLGANPNLIDIDLCTPLHYATQFGYKSIMNVFLNKCQNLDLKCRNVKRMTVLDCCRDWKMREDIQNYFVVHGIENNKVNSKGDWIYSRGIVDHQKGTQYVVRSRSDFIQRILNECNKPYNSCENIQNTESDIISLNNKVLYNGLGSKISKQKFLKYKNLVKLSLNNYQDSLLQPPPIQSIQSYDVIRQLGSGTFGTVFLIRKKKSSKLLALKRLSKKLITQNKMKKYAYAQRQILKNVKHPFILHGYSFFQDSAYLYMVMDFCVGGDLEKFVRKGKFDEQKARKYCSQIILAIQELHRLNYLFRDLKVSNVLIDQEGHVKLADFGLAKKTELSHSFLGSVAYLAPQMLVQTDNKPHTSAIDWYLLGVFVYEMLTGLPPFFNENRLVMFEQIKKQKPRIPANFNPECKDFLLKTLAKKPSQRLGNKGSQQIKKHPWFKSIDWNVVYQRGLKMQVPQINKKQLRTRQYISKQQQLSPQSTQTNNYKGWDFYQVQRN